MDKYELPTNFTKPAIIIVHGGDCRFGDKADAQFIHYSKLFALRDYVAFSLNYRLTGPCVAGGAVPAGYDVRAAIRYIRSRAQAWHIDPDRIAVLGSSAGAIAGLRAAYINENGDQTDYMEYASEPQVVLSISGVLLDGIGQNTSYISPTEARLYLLHGVNDDVVPVQAAVQLAQYAAAINLPAALRLNDQGHVPHHLLVVYLNDMLDFLHQHLSLSSISCGDAGAGDHSNLTAVISVEGQTRSYTLMGQPSSSASLPVVVSIGEVGLASPANTWTLKLRSSQQDRSWNSGSCCGQALTSNASDMVYFLQVLEDIIMRGYYFDGTAITVVGEGDQAMMVMRLAADLSHYVASVVLIQPPFPFWNLSASCLTAAGSFNRVGCPLSAMTQWPKWIIQGARVPDLTVVVNDTESAIVTGGRYTSATQDEFVQPPLDYVLSRLYLQAGASTPVTAASLQSLGSSDVNCTACNANMQATAPGFSLDDAFPSSLKYWQPAVPVPDITTTSMMRLSTASREATQTTAGVEDDDRSQTSVEDTTIIAVIVSLAIAVIVGFAVLLAFRARQGRAFRKLEGTPEDTFEVVADPTSIPPVQAEPQDTSV
eukprot:TRINITY_DN6421_c0_g1_i2.p1 TRINITY_DN6421_c0_g1~~TRINITY_DN6421_c0_g1_i2.p1  ORF type:complete len:659 (+),score=100.50 TRINITY_DN6421_c0_g1_i2:185-1978(+)